METDQILMGAAAIAAILFLVSLIMSFKTWKWHTLLMVFLVLCAAGTFYGMSMQLLRIQDTWRSAYKQNFEDLALEKLKVSELADGVFDEGGKQIEQSVEQLRADVRREVLDRGRHWQGARPMGPPGASSAVTLRLDEPFPARIVENMVVYAFDATRDQLTMDDLENLEAPLAMGPYVGVFRVTNVQENADDGAVPPVDAPAPVDPADPADPDAEVPPEGEGEIDAEEEDGEEVAPIPIASEGHTIITMQPLWRATPEELGRIATATGGAEPNWSLYEKMPVDNRFLLAKIDDKVFQNLYPPATWQNFARDLDPAQDDDPAERVYVQVKFLEEVEWPDFRTQFDPPAIVEEEQPGGEPRQPKKMAIGDTAWLTRTNVPLPGGKELPGADELIEKGTVKLVEDSEPRFERELYDYAMLFQDDYLTRARLQEEIAGVTRKITEVQLSAAEAAALEANFQDVERKLAFDAAGFQREQDAANRYLAALEKRYQQILVELRTEFIANQKMASQIEQIQLSAAAAINRKTQEATTEPISP